MVQQKTVNRIKNALIISILFLGFVNTVITDDITYNAFALLPYFSNFQYRIITMPELYIAILILFIYLIGILVYMHAKTVKEDSSNAEKKSPVIIVSIIAIGVSAIFVLLSVFTLITSKNTDIPEISDGKYLDIHDFGIADKITDTGFEHTGKEIPNRITVKKTISAKLTLTQEYYHIGDKIFYVYQDILEYRNATTALKTAELLSSDKYKNYSEHTADGFEKVYISNENLIAVIDSTVYRVTIITTDKNLVPSAEKLLDSILSKYN